ncbi:brassinosteroid-responsive RING protein 1-like [Prosopis cineraria]|uniref:brassinosteroid-responsive RING protein 1-like n=1 Tax=Prosopis cineraria TaxID=364024 RepID=UPI00240F295A|nr:brassinosteroid-responsive RING protein 1-like [Prosopis cineraria]
MLVNYLKLASSLFKWVLDFLIYHPFYSLRVHYHQPLQEFHQMFTEAEQVETWHRRGEEVDCAVCLSKIGEGDEVRVLRCEHVFHRLCLNQWVGLGNYNCPLCRDFLGSGNRAINGDEGRDVHVLFFKFSSFSSDSERDNWWLR